MKKIVILILASPLPQFEMMQDAIRNTWAKSCNVPENISIIFNYGQFENQNQFVIDNSNLYCPVVNSWNTITLKTFLTFKFLYEHCNFDYIFRCCNGCYLNLEKLNEWIQCKDIYNVYDGETNTHVKPDYCSGAGFLVSKDVVNKLITHNDINFNNVDDCEIGRVLYHKGIYPNRTGKSLHLDEYFSNANDIVINDKSYYHYHFRNHPDFMYKIHEILNDRT